MIIMHSHLTACHSDPYPRLYGQAQAVIRWEGFSLGGGGGGGWVLLVAVVPVIAVADAFLCVFLVGVVLILYLVLSLNLNVISFTELYDFNSDFYFQFVSALCWWWIYVIVVIITALQLLISTYIL